MLSSASVAVNSSPEDGAVGRVTVMSEVTKGHDTCTRSAGGWDALSPGPSGAARAVEKPVSAWQPPSLFSQVKGGGVVGVAVAAAEKEGMGVRVRVEGADCDHWGEREYESEWDGEGLHEVLAEGVYCAVEGPVPTGEAVSEYFIEAVGVEVASGERVPRGSAEPGGQ